jgi:proteasome alpha subunit
MSLADAFKLSVEALDSVTNQKLAPEGLEVAVLDRGRQGRTFRRIPSSELRTLLSSS